MKIIICGAGQVGTDIAKYLSDEADSVTLIDTDIKLTDELNEKIDVRAIAGNGSYPDILQSAGAADTDMIVAVTPSDELNIVICSVAHSLFNIPTKIARIRAPEYLDKRWATLYKKGNIPIDVIISPEMEMAKSITRTLSVPGALEVLPLADGKIYLLAMRCKKDCPLINTPIEKIGAVVPDLHLSTISIIRSGRSLVPRLDEQIEEQDEVYFLVPSEEVSKAAAAFGYDEPSSGKIVIFGAGRTSLFLAESLLDADPSRSITIIEKDSELAEVAANAFANIKVINGDFLEYEILEEAGIRQTETVIALTSYDEDNILGSLLAKRYGVRQTFSLTGKMAYHNLIANLGIDVVLDTKAVTISGIIRNVRKGFVKSSFAIEGGIAELLEIDISEETGYIHKKVKSLDLPKGVFLGAVLRRDKFIVPTEDLTFDKGDRLFFLARHNAVKALEKTFSGGFSLF